jgi:hypothetical protein
MGKHEREDVYIAEKTLNDLLKGQKVDKSRKEHKLFDCANSLAKRIKMDFPSMQESIHIGNIYGISIGNIKLILKNGEEIYLELKFLETGVGTRANIGQNSLTEFHLFKGEKNLSWSDFRKKKNHRGWVEAELNKFKAYPTEIGYIKRREEAINEKAAYLKKMLGVKNKNTMSLVKEVREEVSPSWKESIVAEIVSTIIEKDRKEKLEYISYLRTLEQDHESIKRFLFLILAGAHTHAALEQQWNLGLPKILETLQHKYYVYYIYKRSLKIKVEDYSEKLRNLLDKEIFISFREDQTNILLSFNDNSGNEIPILRVVFHWKNKFQGIQTPCLNIFDDSYLREDPI